ncbi:uncharacterized protein LOC135472795 [Liolophura sinensis]|uniref:uncharacterized protein LOC135472795 n=1 Tax=Liolophura sinensis TaxID=3198878 RepID=UPI003158B875
MDGMGTLQIPHDTPMGSTFDPVGGLLYEQTKHGSDVCDVSLLYGGQEQRVHKCVLMTSHYFHALYESGLLEKDEGKVTINVGSPAAIQAAIKFLYLRHVDVSLENVEGLMEVADYLQISQMKEQCTEFLARLSVGPENCVTLCLIGGQYNYEKLYQVGYDYLIAHLPDVLQHDQMLCLGVDSVLDILRDHTLLYVPADALFSFLTHWVEHDLDQRLPHLPELFDSLDLERFTEEGYHKLVSCHVLINMFPQCRDKVFKFSTKLQAGNARLNGNEKLVFLMAGHEAEPHLLLTDRGRNVEAVGTRRLLGFLPWEKRWLELPPLPIKASSLALLTGLPKSIYATESRPLKNTENMQQLYKYDITHKSWLDVRALIPYYEKGKGFQVLSLQQCGGRIYAIARSTSSLSKGHALNLYLLEEGTLPEMVWLKELVPFGIHVHPSKIKVVIVDDRYICTAIDKSEQGDQEMMLLVYDFETGEVENCSRGSLSLLMMFAREGEIVLAEPGVGYAKILTLGSKAWRTDCHLGIPDLPESVDRSGYSYFYEDDKLFLFGGSVTDRKTYMKSTLMYDFNGQNWESLGLSPSRVINTSSTVVKVGTEAVSCHINCPHCRFTGLKRMAEYEILPSPVSSVTQHDELVEDGWESELEDYGDEGMNEGEDRLNTVQVQVQNEQLG